MKTILYSFTFVLLLIPLHLFSQSSKDTIVGREVKQFWKRDLTNVDEIHKNGLNILSIAKSKKEYMYAYSLIADGLYKKEEYSEALQYYIKADSLSEQINAIKSRFIANFFMTGIYNRVGLSVKAKKYFEKCIELSKNMDKEYSEAMIMQLEAGFMEEAYNYCGAIPIRKKRMLHNKNKVIADSLNLHYKYLLITSLNHLSFDYLKCEQFEEAAKYIKETENTLSKTPIPIDDIDYIHKYYLNKAIYSVEKQNISEAKYWFNRALKSTLDNKRTRAIMQVLEQRINYNIDDLETRKNYITQYNTLKQKTRDEAVKIIALEEELKNYQIKRKTNFIILLVVVLSVLVISIFILVRNYKRKKKKIQQKFKQIIENIQAQNALEIAQKELFIENTHIVKPESPTSAEIKIAENKEVTSNNRIMSQEKEEELLEKLLEFERGKEFIEKNFTISTMANLFETNTKYINYILQQHREKLFSDYINTIRIEYITKLLYNNPDHLNFKISYLADLCGYTSHSRFTFIFKKETGISPSEFISKLSSDKNTSST